MKKYTLEKVLKRVHHEWLPFFDENKQELINILNELNKFDTIYPRRSHLFRATFYHSPKDIRLVILGQDPYISEEQGKPQAIGLSFSVLKQHKIPPSLVNIYTEIKNSYPDYVIPNNGFLKRWAKYENILLLNCSLTVEPHKSNSHAYLWTDFTNKMIQWFQNNNDGCVFLLMGKYSQNKAQYISGKHKIFAVPHPSPLSAYTGFFNSNVFKKINDYLLTKNIQQINW